MTEDSYEYECMRAELLGIEKPDYDQFMKTKAEREAAEQEVFETENSKAAAEQEETFHRVGGRLDELNNILKSTQRKINSFAAPFSNFFKSKVPVSNTIPKNDLQAEQDCFTEPQSTETGCESPIPRKKDPFNTGQLSVMDNLMEKFDRAQVSMEVQTKQMKKFSN
ncbi:hypothetical protein ABEB36_007655 [Hypothenemus hampei]|uniref:Uncharacterized protein n=1 Tax=Hypothenemus hampei TaxID=57062 RepID=A0ABD1EVB1_HYPHA